VPQASCCNAIAAAAALAGLLAPPSAAGAGAAAGLGGDSPGGGSSPSPPPLLVGSFPAPQQPPFHPAARAADRRRGSTAAGGGGGAGRRRSSAAADGGEGSSAAAAAAAAAAADVAAAAAAAREEAAAVESEAFARLHAAEGDVAAVEMLWLHARDAAVVQVAPPPPLHPLPHLSFSAPLPAFARSAWPVPVPPGVLSPRGGRPRCGGGSSPQRPNRGRAMKRWEAPSGFRRVGRPLPTDSDRLGASIGDQPPRRARRCGDDRVVGARPHGAAVAGHGPSATALPRLPARAREEGPPRGIH
jgi:hypothetical protein